MKEFKYVVTDPEGIHARPAGILVKQAAGYKSAVTIVKGEKSADAKRIFGVMGLGVIDYRCFITKSLATILYSSSLLTACGKNWQSLAQQTRDYVL